MVNFFQESTFSREPDSLLGEIVPVDCFSQTDCRLIEGSLFRLSALARNTIVETEDKSVTSISFFCFLLSV